jgi:hypothetical protein
VAEHERCYVVGLDKLVECREHKYGGLAHAGLGLQGVDKGCRVENKTQDRTGERAYLAEHVHAEQSLGDGLVLDCSSESVWYGDERRGREKW